jgi:hypothetical protein
MSTLTVLKRDQGTLSCNECSEEAVPEEKCFIVWPQPETPHNARDKLTCLGSPCLRANPSFITHQHCDLEQTIFLPSALVSHLSGLFMDQMLLETKSFCRKHGLLSLLPWQPELPLHTAEWYYKVTEWTGHNTWDQESWFCLLSQTCPDAPRSVSLALQGSANNHLRAKSHLLPIFVNKVLLEHSYTQSTYILTKVAFL